MPRHLLTRRTMLGSLASAAGSLLIPRWAPALACDPARTIPERYLIAARELLDEHAAIDVHSHPGRFFLDAAIPLHPSLAPLAGTFAAESIAALREGAVSAVVFATVSDLRALEATDGGALAGSHRLAAGAAYRDHRAQLRSFQSLVERGLITHVLEPEDIARARDAPAPGGILSTEGSDFLEGHLDRLAEASADGVRMVTLVHYRINETGDIQTAEPRHGGLTAFGEAVVHEMNRLGLVIDLAHASPAALRRACELTTRPVVVSHANLQRADFTHPRLLDADSAARIAQTGGLIGAWPAGLGIDDFAGFIDEILRLIDQVGVAHVGIGTDMDANYRPVFSDYRKFAFIPAALLARGLDSAEVAAIVGGNFLRVFRAVRG